MSNLFPISAFFIMMGCFIACNQHGNSEDYIRSLELPNYDTVWNIDKSEFDIGKLVGGERIGLWQHRYMQDTSRWDERYFIEDEKLIRVRFFKHGRQFLEENYLSAGTFSIAFHENGCIARMGWHKTVGNQFGEEDGLWMEFDSLGNLHSETFYDYQNDKVLYREYDPILHQLQKECEYFQETGEATLYKNGTWKYYLKGKLDRSEVFVMESTLEAMGD